MTDKGGSALEVILSLAAILALFALLKKTGMVTSGTQ